PAGGILSALAAQGVPDAPDRRAVEPGACTRGRSFIQSRQLLAVARSAVAADGFVRARQAFWTMAAEHFTAAGAHGADRALLLNLTAGGMIWLGFPPPFDGGQNVFRLAVARRREALLLSRAGPQP